MYKKTITVFVILFFIISTIAPMVSSDNSYQNDTIRLKAYFCYVELELEKRYNGAGAHSGGGGSSYRFYVDAESDELFIDIVMNYTAEMTYSHILTWPICFAPIIAYGLMVENYTDYTWKTIKMKNYGYDFVEGNITVEIEVDMSNAKSGEHIFIAPNYVFIWNNILDSEILNYSHTLGLIAPNNETMKWAVIMRILYNLPVVGEFFLHNWLLPYLEPWNRRIKNSPNGDLPGRAGIWVYFK